MSDRYKLVIDQSSQLHGNDPQVAEGDLAFVVAALAEWAKYPRYGLNKLTVERA